MLSVYRICFIFFVAVAAWTSAAGAAVTIQVTGEVPMETLMTIIALFGMMGFGILGAGLWCLRRILKRYDPDQIDPVTRVMAENLIEDMSGGPAIKRFEDIERQIALLIEEKAQIKAERESNIGSGELYLKSKE